MHESDYEENDRDLNYQWANALTLHKERIRRLQEALCECPHRDIFQADLHDEVCPVYVVTRDASSQDSEQEVR